MLFLEAVDAQSHGDVQSGALVEHANHIGDNAPLNLAIGSDVHRFEAIVRVEGARDFRQILAGEWLAAGQNQDAKIAAKRFGDRFNFARFHLKFFARAIIQLLGEKAVSAAHVAYRSHQNVQHGRRERLSQSQFSVAF